MSRESLVSNIPNYDAFLTVDELNDALRALAADYPGIVEVFEAGVSRAGSPVLCAKVGSGSRSALMYGCPHPNEPIGAMMCHYFARAIAEDRDYRQALDFTFYIIPVSDVDGTRLNEKWFKGPFTVYHYARNFFRPSSDEQVEWTFPMNYKDYCFDRPMPETRALMKIIDEVQPAFIYSLHNAGFGGAYWYISHRQPQAVYDALYKAAENRVPLDLGEPEMPFAVEFAKAVYKMPFAADMYDYFEKYTEGNAADTMSGGECSGAYAGPDTVELVTELPYFYEARVQSRKLLDYPRLRAIEEKLQSQKQHVAQLRSFYDRIGKSYSANNPFAKMLATTLQYLGANIEGERAYAQSEAKFRDPCSEAEAFSNGPMTRFYHLLNWGLMIRSAEHELEQPDPKNRETLQAVQKETEALLCELSEQLESELDYSVIPIRDLVAVQLESGLQILERL